MPSQAVFSSVQSLDQFGRRWDLRDDSAEILFQSFLQEALVNRSRMGRDVHSFDVVHPAFPLSTMASSTLQGAMKDGFGEAVMACDMPKLCKKKQSELVALNRQVTQQLPSLDSCQKTFLWTHKKDDLAPHLGVGLVFQLGESEKFPQTFGFESLDLFFQSQHLGSMFHSHI